MQEELYCVAFSHIQKIGPARMKKLMAIFPSLEEAWNADFVSLCRAGLEESIAQELIEFRSKNDVQKLWDEIQCEHVAVITINSLAYPKLLKQIYDPPMALYVRGTIPQNEFLLGVVGTRKMSTYGKHVADLIIPPLARAGITIVSGLAIGIDAYVHELTIQEHGATIAVLGSGLASDNIYPSSNRMLAQKIIEQGGALISEYPIHMPPLQHHFPVRNRIISGLSLGVLVIEAAQKSGSLITAHHALDQNRDVFAVPGDITREGSSGTNSLLRLGAHLVTTHDDILEALNLSDVTQNIQARTIIPDSVEEEKILAILAQEPAHIDAITQLSGLDSSTVSSTLTLMEIKGMVRHMGGMNYTLAR